MAMQPRTSTRCWRCGCSCGSSRPARSQRRQLAAHAKAHGDQARPGAREPPAHQAAESHHAARDRDAGRLGVLRARRAVVRRSRGHRIERHACEGAAARPSAHRRGRGDVVLPHPARAAGVPGEVSGDRRRVRRERPARGSHRRQRRLRDPRRPAARAVAGRAAHRRHALDDLRDARVLRAASRSPLTRPTCSPATSWRDISSRAAAACGR